MHYTETAEAVVASGGSDLAGGGGARTVPTGPSLSRLQAAEALGDMRLALSAGAVVLRGRGRRPRPVTVAWVDLIEAAAINGHDCTTIARAALGMPSPSQRQIANITAALGQAAAALVEQCGHSKNSDRCAAAQNL